MKLVEVIDLYNLHDDPKSLYGYDRAYNEVPELAWQKYACNKDGYTKLRFTAAQKAELKKREYLWAQDPGLAYEYAFDVLNGRFPAGENILFTQGNYDIVVDYITRFASGNRIEAVEQRLLNDDRHGDFYVTGAVMNYIKAIKQKWPEGEQIIMKEPRIAVEYAIYKLKGKWPEAEQYIATDAKSSWLYAKHALKGRFPAGEKVLKLMSDRVKKGQPTANTLWDKYQRYIKKKKK